MPIEIGTTSQETHETLILVIVQEQREWSISWRDN